MDAPLAEKVYYYFGQLALFSIQEFLMSDHIRKSNANTNDLEIGKCFRSACYGCRVKHHFNGEGE
jgi:hypothetical protein